MKKIELIFSLLVEIILTGISGVTFYTNNMQLISYFIITIGLVFLISTIFWYLFTKKIQSIDKQHEIFSKNILTKMNLNYSLLNRKINILTEFASGKRKKMPKNIDLTNLEKELAKEIYGDRVQQWLETFSKYSDNDE